VTMISCGVEISIARGGGEMVRASAKKPFSLEGQSPLSD